MIDVSDIEKPIRPKEDLFTATYPYSKEFARVSVDPSALRRDFISEAINQGMDREKAEGFVDKVNFTFGNLKSLEEKASGLLGEVSRIYHRVVKGEPFGFIVPNKDGGFTCNIGVETIVHQISEKGSFRGFHILHDISNEARHAAVAQALDVVWRHERKHLIQLCCPDIFEDQVTEPQRLENVRRVGLTGYIIGNGLVLVSALMPGITQDKRAFLATFIIGASSAVTSSLMLAGAEIYQAHFSPSERNLDNVPGRTLPFKVSFES